MSTLSIKVKKYLIDAIEKTDYNGKELTTKREKVQWLKETFEKEYSHEIKRLGKVKALESWLMGLPSSIYIEWENYYIIKLAQSWGSLPANPTEKQEDKILNNYWFFMASHLSKLFELLKTKESIHLD